MSSPSTLRSLAAGAICAALALPGIVRAHGERGKDDQREKTLYVWAGDLDRVRPDFLAVVDFDERSPRYGQVLRTVPLPPPGNAGNEPHHCNLSADKDVLACGGLLSVLSGQAGIFFFDVSDARHPRFLLSTAAPNSSITDDFLPLPGGGFLVTQMGSASGGAPGRLAEFSRNLTLIAEHPLVPPTDGFNPHGISADFRRNLMVTSDFLMPATTLNAVPGPIELRGALRFWDLASRGIIRTVVLPEAMGSMDVKLIPGDPHGRAVTANMFSGLVYTVDPTDGSVVQSFDCEDIVPHVEVPVRGGMVQLLAMPRRGDRLIFASFQAGQVGMLDITDRNAFVQKDVVDLGLDAGPHNIVLTGDDSRLVVSDYFLDQDGFGKVHFEGDHRVHVIRVGRDTLELDTRFQLDFDTAFEHPARPHGMAMK
ncbi:MAG TPA: selenium-binding protein SBP56-related protein [Anaeromyxobacteraceae bacterium]|nr:selenium-binding protein SBP56-related protein [Anaeromyxobacteraceae bacterium]